MNSEVKKFLLTATVFFLVFIILFILVAVYYQVRVRGNDDFFTTINYFKKSAIEPRLIFLGDSHPTMDVRNRYLPKDYYNFSYHNENWQRIYIRSKYALANKDSIKYLVIPCEYHSFSEIKAKEMRYLADLQVMAALTEGRLLIKKAPMDQLDMFLTKLRDIGVNFRKDGQDLEVFESKNLRAIRIQALPHPGFPTDLLPLVVPLLTQAEGKSLIHDPLYENRLNYTQELRKMGADIEIVDPHRAFVFGPTPLKGVTIESWDIRAGASLVAAGLIAEGKTTIKNIEQIDRGYECLEERLNKLGANIKRVSG